MRIALVAPLAEAVPPKLYGGIERVVSWLAEELVRQGHRVALFASAESETAAELVVCAPQSLRLAGIRDHLGSTLAMLREVRRRADDFDIIHFHVDLLPQALFHDLAHKCLVTLHGRLDLPDALPLYKAYPEMSLVSISNAQRRPMPICPAERSGQPGEQRQGRDRVDRREERRKILADFNQKRRHMSERVFYPDTNDVSSTSKVVALSIASQSNA